MIIEDVAIRRIIDSRGNPTVEAEIRTNSGFGRAAAPAGASTGTHEAVAWPNGDVSKGIKFAEEKLMPGLIGGTVEDQKSFDKILRETDGTNNFRNMGGNISVAFSLAAAKAAANSKNISLYQHVGNKTEYSLPAPMANVLGGGAHAIGGTDIQEYLVTSFDKDINTAIEANAMVHKKVGSLLKDKFPNIALGKGDEGAWVAPLKNIEALELVVKAANQIEQETGVEIRPGLDIAASEFYHNGKYKYKEQTLTAEQQVDFVLGMIEEYNLHSVEDPLDQEDFESWALLTEQTDALIIGDDLYVTNTERLKKGIEMNSTNSILIKPNQIGTLTDTINAVELAKQADMATVISHRSGETTDTTIAHLGVAFDSHAIKTGIMGGERIAKLNELVRISEEL
ncbi:MAG: phosphopyruvate hydratase [Methanobacteriota archaeon]|nr:MAG: phosphopyruvate hydratase [Euryarchaeota archaeon]